jgi:GlpG protein
MSNRHVALSAPVQEDLLPLSALLHQRGVSHRIFEEGGRQVLEVQGGEQQARQVAALYQSWRKGDVKIELTEGRLPRVSPARGLPLRRAPITIALVLLSILGFFLVYFRAPVEWIGLLTFTPVEVVAGSPQFTTVDGQYWRLITPAFLHFGWLHIVFNGLWLWELGSRVESVLGSLNMLALFLVVAMVSNGSQYAFGGPGLFGGMSGVVYGLLGFCWVAPLLQPRWKIQPAPVIVIFMIGWLVACLVGLVEVLGFGAIANAAHLGGLLCGVFLGGAFGALSRATETAP